MTSASVSVQRDYSDADLVLASRNGDRAAFGEIVRRYQGMISGLVYAGCGDLHRSEDVAQETFLSAWKSLSGLREPAKLPAWLCQIARHRMQDLFRKSSTEKTRVGGFWSRMSATTSPPVDEEIARHEEEAVLWRALSEVPQPYRETLVLYYRHGQSTEQVALAMETTEASIRQRLARGREMLRGQVAEMIERNLTTTTPSPAFALGVLSALPAVAPEAAKAAAAGTAAKGSLTANANWLMILAGWIGMISGVGVGIIGSWHALRDDSTVAERKATIRFLVQLWLLVILVVPAAFAVFHWGHQLKWSDETFVSLLAGLFGTYWALIATVTLRYQVKSAHLRNPHRPLTFKPRLAIVMAAGTTIGALEWLVNLAAMAHDYLSVAVVAIAMVVIIAAAVYVLRRAARLMMMVYTVGYLGVIAAMLNWRMDSWLATLRGTDLGSIHLPLWSVNVLAFAVIAWVTLITRWAFAAHPQTLQ